MPGAGGSTAADAGMEDLGADITVYPLGLGAMRITGGGIWGEPPDRNQARAVLRGCPARTWNSSRSRQSTVRHAGRGVSGSRPATRQRHREPMPGGSDASRPGRAVITEKTDHPAVAQGCQQSKREGPQRPGDRRGR